MTNPACRWCGEPHGPLCPYVKALEFAAANGGLILTRVEFLTPMDHPRQRQEREPEPDYPRAPSKES